MAKYDYWHIITKVSDEYQKVHPELKVGLAITHQYKKDNEGVCMVDLVKGIEYPGAYVLKYLGRLPKDIPNEEKFKKLKELSELQNGSQNE